MTPFHIRGRILRRLTLVAIAAAQTHARRAQATADATR